MLFLDTSALVKRYVDEEESEEVIRLMAREQEWSASALALPETRITLCHLGFDDSELERLVESLEADWDRFYTVPVDELCLAEATEIGCTQRLRTPGAIHLAAAKRMPGPPALLTFDERQRNAAGALGLQLAG